MDKKEKRFFEDLPFKLGAASLAIILGIGEGFFKTLEGILEGPRLTVGKAYRKAIDTKDFWDYYEEIKSLKENSLRIYLWRLQQKGLIDKKRNHLFLTHSGLKYFQKLKNREPEEKWDGKWRIVMFDIPEKIKKEREWLRTELIASGYKPLQKSVFLGKFPIKENLFKEIIAKQLNKHLNLITVGEIDDEEILNSFD